MLIRVPSELGVTNLFNPKISLSLKKWNFREIKSQHSSRFIKGLRKVSLTCDDYPYAHCFIWMDVGDIVSHIQLTFDQHYVEINSDYRLNFGHTLKHGTNGVRILNRSSDLLVLEKAFNFISLSTFPDNFIGGYEILYSGLNNLFKASGHMSHSPIN